VLTLEDATPYLLEHGLITPSTVIEGNLSVSSVVRRNRNLFVTRVDGPGYLLKQPDGEDSVNSLQREAAFCAFCHAEPATESLRRWVPVLRHVDSARHVLGLELFPGARPLWTHYSGFAPGHFPAGVPAGLGEAMGTVHRLFRAPELREDPRLAWMTRGVPWILRVHRPVPEMLATLSLANYRVLGLVQAQPGLSRQLDALRLEWREDTVIHGDIKSDNVLVVPPVDADGEAQVRLVDWELAQVGDPAWDVAGTLQDFVMFWLLSVPGDAMSADEMTTRAGYPLRALHPGLRAFWRAYRAASGLSRADADALLRRAVRYSGARLIQSAFEMGQAAHVLPRPSVLLLQISANLLAQPELGQVQLYGLYHEGPSHV